MSPVYFIFLAIFGSMMWDFGKAGFLAFTGEKEALQQTVLQCLTHLYTIVCIVLIYYLTTFIFPPTTSFNTECIRFFAVFVISVAAGGTENLIKIAFLSTMGIIFNIGILVFMAIYADIFPHIGWYFFTVVATASIRLTALSNQQDLCCVPSFTNFKRAFSQSYTTNSSSNTSTPITGPSDIKTSLSLTVKDLLENTLPKQEELSGWKKGWLGNILRFLIASVVLIFFTLGSFISKSYKLGDTLPANKGLSFTTIGAFVSAKSLYFRSSLLLSLVNPFVYSSQKSLWFFRIFKSKDAAVAYVVLLGVIANSIGILGMFVYLSLGF